MLTYSQKLRLIDDPYFESDSDPSLPARPIMTMLVRVSCPKCGAERWATQYLMMDCVGCNDAWRSRAEDDVVHISASQVAGDL